MACCLSLSSATVAVCSLPPDVTVTDLNVISMAFSVMVALGSLSGTSMISLACKGRGLQVRRERYGVVFGAHVRAGAGRAAVNSHVRVAAATAIQIGAIRARCFI